MTGKIIDSIIEMLQNAVILFVVLFGVYAAYELLFNMGIPIGFFIMMIAIIGTVAWAATAENYKQPAIPITIVPEGQAKPTFQDGVING